MPLLPPSVPSMLSGPSTLGVRWSSLCFRVLVLHGTLQRQVTFRSQEQCLSFRHNRRCVPQHPSTVSHLLKGSRLVTYRQHARHSTRATPPSGAIKGQHHTLARHEVVLSGRKSQTALRVPCHRDRSASWHACPRLCCVPEKCACTSQPRPKSPAQVPPHKLINDLPQCLRVLATLDLRSRRESLAACTHPSASRRTTSRRCRL